MSVQSITWAYAQDVPSHGPKFLLVTLANYADESGVSWPSQKRLCGDLSSSERSVRRWLSELLKLGLVMVRKRGKGRTPDALVYRLCDSNAMPPAGGHWESSLPKNGEKEGHQEKLSTGPAKIVVKPGQPDRATRSACPPPPVRMTAPPRSA